MILAFVTALAILPIGEYETRAECEAAAAHIDTSATLAALAGNATLECI